MFNSLSTSLIARGILALAVGVIALAWPSVTVLALVVMFPRLRVRCARPAGRPRLQQRHGRTGRRAPAARPGRPGRGASRKELSRCFLVRIPAWIFLGAWFLYQLIEANFGLFNAHANAGGVAFFAHVGGFVFGLLTARLLARAGQAAPRKQWPSTA